MAKRNKNEKKSDAAESGRPAKEAGDSAKSKKPAKRQDGIRETVESIVVAFILAFLFRTFEAEAFVIPTGSMAPTLFGRHKDIDCEQCGHHYSIGASDEVESPGWLYPNRLVRDAVCPNCRHITPAEVVQALPVYKGDRILVNKFPFEFGDPQRWDVVVFKYPEEPQTNYIKRLVGLPGEQLEIRQGDVYVHTKDGVNILRKDDPDKQNQLQILVYDNDHPAKKLQDGGWPERWAAVRRNAAKPDDKSDWATDDSGWKADERRFSLSTSATEDDKSRWLRYRHVVPSPEDWQAILNGAKPQRPRPQLITDFCGYNAYTGGNSREPKFIDYGVYWVGDLTVNCEVDVQDLTDNAEIVLELIEGLRSYRCRFNLQTGECTLSHNDDLLSETDNDRLEKDRIVLASAETRLKGVGKHRVTFANVDSRLNVWVDGKLIDFGTNDDGVPRNVCKQISDTEKNPGYQKPTNADLAPVGIAAKHCDITVSRLLLNRDIYYRAERVESEQDLGRDPRYIREYVGEASGASYPIFPILNSKLHDPAGWWATFKEHRKPATFNPLGPDEYFMMGDNSPRSRDSRLWPNFDRQAKNRHAVPRSALVGKAFFTYWPHGIPFLRNGRGFPITYHTTVSGEKTDYPSFRFPFYPNFKRMGRIR